MASLPPILTEGLPIRRLGLVSQATATIWRDDNNPYAKDQPESRLVPISFPIEIPMEGGWRLQHASPTTGKLVTQNWLVELFHSPQYNNLQLSAFRLYNIGLLESVAAVFTSKHSAGLVDWSLRTGEGTPLLPGESPNLTYYRPLEAPEEQYLLLYTTSFAPSERPNEKPSFTNFYALAQVELDEERLVFLLKQALDAAYEARLSR